MSGYRPLAAVVLAAGEGTRMRSETPKVLHPLCGRAALLPRRSTPLVALPLRADRPRRGPRRERVTKTLQEQIASEMPIEFVEQRVQRGTGDAVSVGLHAFSDDPDLDGDVLVMPAMRRSCVPRCGPGWPVTNREADAAGDAAHAELTTTYQGLRPARPRTTGPRGPHRREDRRVPPRSWRSTRSTLDLLLPARAARAGAMRRLSPRSPGRVLPDRRGRGAAPRGPRGCWPSPRTTGPQRCT